MGSIELANRELEIFSRMKQGKLSSEEQLKEDLVLEGIAPHSTLEDSSP
jgi:hypothetical protein